MTLALGAAAALVVGCGLVYLLVARPQRGLLLLAALSPLNGVLILVPKLPLGYWKEGVLGLTLLAAVLTVRRRVRTNPPMSVPWWPAAGALAVLGSASALVTAGVVGLIAIKITFFYLVIGVILWLAPFDARDRDQLVTVVMVMGPLTALVGLWQQVVGAQYLVGLGYRYNDEVRTAGGLLRSFSTFNQPFPFGLYVMTALLLGGAVALAEPRRRRNTVFLCLTPIMVAGMGVSIVRASYLGLILGVVWLGIHRYPRILVATAAAGAAAVPVVLALPSTVLAPLLSASSLGQRSDGWTGIVKDVLAHPLGQGLGTSGSAADRIAKSTGAAAVAVYQPDNYYVKMALELGPLGLWLFVLLLLSGLVSTLRAARLLTGRDSALALGVSACMVAVAAASTVATYLEIFPLDVYFWLLLGVVGCAVAQHASGSTRSRSGREAAASRPMRVS